MQNEEYSLAAAKALSSASKWGASFRRTSTRT